MIDSARALRDSLGSNVTDAQIKSQVDDVLKFESQLAMVGKLLEFFDYSCDVFEFLDFLDRLPFPMKIAAITRACTIRCR